MKRRWGLALVAFAIVIGSTWPVVETSAISVPKLIVDPSSCTVADRSKASLTGTVYPAAGQVVMLYSTDRRNVLCAVRITGSGGKASFRLKVPETALKDKTSVTLYIRSGAAGTVTASKYIPVEMKVGSGSSVRGTGAAPVTSDGKATKAGAVKATKATGAAKATKKTSKTGKIKKAAKKNAKKTTKKRPKKKSRPKTAAEGRAAAVAWAKKIAADNRFTYGTYPYANHNGCYFCGTNGGKKKRARGTRWANGYNGKKWNRTYCCNPFVHACYAHGAMHPTMLKNCKRKNAIDMTKASYRKMGCFKCLGKPKYSKLIAGDILVCRTHVMLYCGNGYIAEATSFDGAKRSWSASSIRVVKKAKKKYRRCKFVMRFTGY